MLLEEGRQTRADRIMAIRCWVLPSRFKYLLGHGARSLGLPTRRCALARQSILPIPPPKTNPIPKPDAVIQATSAAIPEEAVSSSSQACARHSGITCAPHSGMATPQWRRPYEPLMP